MMVDRSEVAIPQHGKWINQGTVWQRRPPVQMNLPPLNLEPFNVDKLNQYQEALWTLKNSNGHPIPLAKTITRELFQTLENSIHRVFCLMNTATKSNLVATQF